MERRYQDLRNRVLNWMYTHSLATTQDLAQALGVPEHPVRTVLGRLLNQKLVYRWRAPFGRFGDVFPFTSRPYIYAPVPIEDYLLRGFLELKAEAEIDRAEREILGKSIGLGEGTECGPDLASKLRSRMSELERAQLRRCAIELLRSRGRIGCPPGF